MKVKHILGTVTIVSIIGGTIYAIKKSKDMKKTEGEEISLDEAKAIVSGGATDENRVYRMAQKCVDDFDSSYPTYFEDKPKTIIAKPYEEESFEEDEEIEEEIVEIYPEEHGRPWKETMTEEDKVLRCEPSSLDALHQFKRMELAEWAVNEDTYQTMVKLFDFPFEPQNDGDDMLRTQIIDYRVQFFGFSSKWAQQVSYADVILHYSRAAHFNCDESVRYWVDYFLDFNDLYHAYSSNTIDEALRALNSHAYFNEERATFGLFGLTRQSMDQAIKIANRNIDRSVTYEIEFNEFLKSCL